MSDVILVATSSYSGKGSEELNAKKGEEFTLISDKHAGWFYVSSVRDPDLKGYLPALLFNQREEEEETNSEPDGHASPDDSYGSESGTATTDYTNSTHFSSDDSGDDDSESKSEDSNDMSDFDTGKPLIARRLSTILRPRSNSTMDVATTPLSAYPNMKPSILGRFWSLSPGMLSKTIQPQLNSAQTDFRDLIYDHRKKSIKKIKTKCLVPVTIREVKNLPATLENAKLFDHKLRMSLYDKSAVLSNVYSVNAQISNKTWKFHERTVHTAARVPLFLFTYCSNL